ncbi:MAG: hypothetical protein R2909_05215 [Gemmatimonadales bacterium]
MIDKFGSPTVTKDGVTVAKEVEKLSDPIENMGAQMVEVATADLRPRRRQHHHRDRALPRRSSARV